MRIAQISDLHILDLTDVPMVRFANRRVFGGANLLFRRAREYRPDILEALVEDLLQEEVDHVVVSGDLSNLALEPEFMRVFDLLKLLGDWSRVSVVPGNHDYYTYRAADTRRFEKTFYPFMFRGTFSDLDMDIYPYVKRLNDVLLVGVNSATRTVPPFSYGTVGKRQLERLDALLGRLESQDAFKIVVLHHALHARDKWAETTSRLLNRDAFMELMEKHSVNLVLHGHDHHGRIWKKRWDSGHTTNIICCGSSTRLVDDPSKIARYRIVHIDEGRLRKIETKIFDPGIRKFMPS